MLLRSPVLHRKKKKAEHHPPPLHTDICHGCHQWALCHSVTSLLYTPRVVMDVTNGLCVNPSPTFSTHLELSWMSPMGSVLIRHQSSLHTQSCHGCHQWALCHSITNLLCTLRVVMDVTNGPCVIPSPTFSNTQSCHGCHQ